MTYLLGRIRVRRPALMILLAMLGGLVGCDEDENARVAQVATQAAVAVVWHFGQWRLRQLW